MFRCIACNGYGNHYCKEEKKWVNNFDNPESFINLSHKPKLTTNEPLDIPDPIESLRPSFEEIANSVLGRVRNHNNIRDRAETDQADLDRMRRRIIPMTEAVQLVVSSPAVTTGSISDSEEW